MGNSKAPVATLLLVDLDMSEFKKSTIVRETSGVIV